MFKADDYRLKIQAMKGVLAEAGYALDIEHLKPRLAELEKEQESPDVWQDLERSTKIGREVAQVRAKINAYEAGETALSDAADVVDLIEETINVNLSEQQLEERRKKWAPIEQAGITRFLRRYSERVESSNKGAILK